MCRIDDGHTSHRYRATSFQLIDKQTLPFYNAMFVCYIMAQCLGIIEITTQSFESIVGRSTTLLGLKLHPRSIPHIAHQSRDCITLFLCISLRSIIANHPLPIVGSFCSKIYFLIKVFNFPTTIRRPRIVTHHLSNCCGYTTSGSMFFGIILRRPPQRTIPIIGCILIPTDLSKQRFYHILWGKNRRTVNICGYALTHFLYKNRIAI